MFGEKGCVEWEMANPETRPPPKLKPKYSRKSQVAAEIHFNNRLQRKGEAAAFLEQLRTENQQLRKPCKICNNLVRPELLKQHNEAYHSSAN